MTPVAAIYVNDLAFMLMFNLFFWHPLLELLHQSMPGNADCPCDVCECLCVCTDDLLGLLAPLMNLLSSSRSTLGGSILHISAFLQMFALTIKHERPQPELDVLIDDVCCCNPMNAYASMLMFYFSPTHPQVDIFSLSTPGKANCCCDTYECLCMHTDVLFLHLASCFGPPPQGRSCRQVMITAAVIYANASTLNVLVPLASSKWTSSP